MSYRRPDTGDPELDRKLAAEDFEMLFPRLLTATTDQGFAVWLDKLAGGMEDRGRAFENQGNTWREQTASI